jgi:hypothetical protein
MHQTARAGREGQNTKDSSVISLLQLIHQDTVPKKLACYSWYYCLKYQRNEYNPFARDGTSGHITNGIYLIPLQQLAHQATVPMESVSYLCYSWHNRPHYQWIQSHTPATADTSGHSTNGVSLIPLLQLAHQATLPMDSVSYPCYSWHNRPHYQLAQTYTPATADKTD